MTTSAPTVDDLIRTGFDTPEAIFGMIRQHPALLEARTGLGETALHYLAVENQLSAVERLIDLGAQVNTCSRCGGTPLSEAASLGYVELVAFLLSRGARVRIDGQRGPTLHEAVRSGDAEIVRLILAAGAPVDERNTIRETALHLAAQDDTRLEILALLIQAGADVSVTRIFDETPLDVAHSAGASACASALIAAGTVRRDPASDA